MWSRWVRAGGRGAHLEAVGWVPRRQSLPQQCLVRLHSGELEPLQCTRWRVLKGVVGGSEEERSLGVVLGLSAALGFGLGTVNLSLQRYVQHNPHSLLARDIEDDCRRMCNYIVPISSTIAGLGLWLAAVFTGPFSVPAMTGWAGWWFGAQQQWAVTGLLGLSAGHYAQEILANQWCGVTLMLHHVVAIGTALCMQATNCWRGLLLSWGALYEAGSLLLCLGYVGVVPRLAGHWAATVSSLAGMGLGLHGLIARQSRQRINAPAWFTVVILFVLGLGRIQEGAENLLRLTQKKN